MVTPSRSVRRSSAFVYLRSTLLVAALYPRGKEAFGMPMVPGPNRSHDLSGGPNQRNDKNYPDRIYPDNPGENNIFLFLGNEDDLSVEHR